MLPHPPADFFRMGDRVGGGVTSPVLSHHRAYGSVPRRFKVGSGASLPYPPATPVPTARNTDSARPPSGARRRYSTTALVRCSRFCTLALPVTPVSSAHALSSPAASTAATGSLAVCGAASRPPFPRRAWRRLAGSTPPNPAGSGPVP